MRILASLILAMTVASAIPANAAGADVDSNQNAKQILETKITNTLSDNFLVALYTPKVGNTQFSKMYKNKLLSENFILPKGSFVVNASAYTAAADECGKSDGITASGAKGSSKPYTRLSQAVPDGNKNRNRRNGNVCL